MGMELVNSDFVDERVTHCATGILKTKDMQMITQISIAIDKYHVIFHPKCLAWLA